jgi:purine-binding chemotaxis protein CheW
VSSEDLRMMQRNQLASNQQGRTSTQQAMAALQMQLAQVSLPRPEGSPVAENAPAVVGEQYLIFSLFDRELAVKAELVQGVERLVDLTPVPNVVSWVKGVMNLRGSIVSVIDLRMFLGIEQLPYTPRTRLLSLQYNEMVVCFVVDGVSEMQLIPPTAIMNGNARQASIPSWVHPYANGCALSANRVLVLLDVSRLLFSEKMQHYQL